MEHYSGDMIANLTTLPAMQEIPCGIKVRRALANDKKRILAYIAERFSEGWVLETEYALSQSPISCFIATEGTQLVGFACYDTSAKGFFGPIGVSEEMRGKRIGQALLLRTLEAMRETGYGYAIIGWVDDAQVFYEKCVRAVYIPGGEPKNSVFSRMISMG